MPVIQTLAEILVALLAVVGFYAILRLLAASLLCPRQVVVALLLEQAVDAETLDILLDEARRNPARRRGARVTVFVSRALLDGRMGEDGRLHATYADVLARYGADWYMAEHPAPQSET